MSLLITVYRLLGRRVCALLLPPIAFYFLLFSPSHRGASLDYLSRLFGEAQSLRERLTRWHLSFQHLLEFAHALLDKFAVWQGDLDLGSFTWRDKDPLKNLLLSGQGAVVLGAHLGNIEAIRAIATELPQVRVNALMFREHNPLFNTMLKRINPESQLRIIPTERLGPELISELQERIRAGEIVSMLGDRILPTSPSKAIRAPFLGAEASFPSGPFILASLLECPVFLAFCTRTGERSYVVTFEHFCDRLTLPRKEREAALRREVARFALRLEHYTRETPLQWFNFFRFWE